MPPAVPGTSRERETNPSPAAAPLVSVSAYRELGALACGALAPLLGPLEWEGASLDASELEHSRASHVVLSSVEHQLELCLSLLVEPSAASSIAHGVLGVTDSDAVVDDLLCELANIVGGVFRTAAAAEHPVLAGSLPMPGRAGSIGAVAEQAWWLRCVGKDARVLLVATVRQRDNEVVVAAQLREGMVVAHDVRDGGGRVVVKAGTRLSETGAVRMTQSLGGSQKLDVAIVK